MNGYFAHVFAAVVRRGLEVGAVALALVVLGATLALSGHESEPDIPLAFLADRIAEDIAAAPRDSVASLGVDLAGAEGEYHAVRQPLAPGVHEVARLLSIEVPATPTPVARATRAAAPSAPVAPYVPPVALASLRPGEQVQASISFYYCERSNVGDGGGFCGHTADGTPVQLGVAACSRQYLGQVFRVVGDPSGMVFRCADTGSAVVGQHRDIWFPTAGAAGQWMAHVGYSAVIEILE